MGAQLRVYRQKINSTKSMRKLFKAMELIAASRITKARSRVAASLPYANAITRAVSAVASQTEIDHPLTTEPDQVRRAAVVLLSSDRGQAGAYSTNVIKQAEQLNELLHSEGKDIKTYLVGNKSQLYYQFRDRPFERSWLGNTDAPVFETAQEIAQTLLQDFSTEYEEGGVDEIHIVYTRFQSMVTQVPTVVRLLPLEVVEEEVTASSETLPLYDFEPETEQVLDALLPRYIESRIFAAMLQAAASELASRQKAMKAATDNADDLVDKYTRLSNTARQAEITQELSEIVAGADSLGA
ncbi:F0F1 ATP synthase subunit gamma [Arthrobacter castelli]|uniref:F0F1 ATP synthase subunit gamma n=1 Tax=Arthrobacter castelli TaxID=271431 RepID=UPI0004186478|nr:F0F1 ATP synthase subunit gamma [Arthrobacter castelli]